MFFQGYITSYVELIAIQKSLFEISDFSEINPIFISKAVNYCQKQHNFRNSVILESICKKLDRLRAAE